MYQPISKTMEPPKPPTSGSNIIKSQTSFSIVDYLGGRKVMTLQEKVQKGLDCWCGRIESSTKDDCRKHGCPYVEVDNDCSIDILRDVDKLMKQCGMNEKDFKLIENDLKSALKYQEDLNQQMMGRLDIYERIIKMILKILIDAATDRR